MNEFSKYHPAVNFMYFIAVTGFTCFFMHPWCLAISFAAGFIYSVMMTGKKAVGFFGYMIPVIIIAALMNPLFNHAGVTILAYFPNGNPLTLESVKYGICAAVMIVSIIYHFSNHNEIMTSDKFIYLFGKIIPSFSLILSMTLRFVPLFKARFREVAAGQKCIGNGTDEKHILKKIKNAARITSIMITWSLENSIDTADSMKSRGYGLSGRTAYSNYRLEKRDIIVISAIAALSVYVLTGAICGCVKYNYFPKIEGADVTLYGISVFAAYFTLCVIPIVIECKEAITWKLSRRKI